MNRISDEKIANIIESIRRGEKLGPEIVGPEIVYSIALDLRDERAARVAAEAKIIELAEDLLNVVGDLQQVAAVLQVSDNESVVDAVVKVASERDEARAQVRALEAVIAAQEELLVAYRMHNQKLAGKALDKLQRAREALRKEVKQGDKTGL